ncbi:MAG: OsmC family protein [Thaumarchaeota archaeon]|nr:OsmC family protein [Nitrososphaerota archaeon]
MLTFPRQLKEAMKEEYRLLAEVKDPAKWRGVIRVDAKYLDGLKREAKSGGHAWIADSKKDVGGEDSAPGPLAYFISGICFCQLAHYAERSSHMDLKIESIELTVRAHYNRRPGGYFDKIIYETRIVSDEPEERIKDLVVNAEHDCYVTNTLSKAAEITGNITLNGKPFMITHPRAD